MATENSDYRTMNVTRAERMIAMAGLTYSRYEWLRRANEGAPERHLQFALEGKRFELALSSPAVFQENAAIPITPDTEPILRETAATCMAASTAGLRNLAPELHELAERAAKAYTA